ncbi:hypothetical protein [Actinophytocola sp.]|uniref:hypothetical protein n=1 Tax=Actinophytocola sp. TaxID=1872138 RepID=UPI00389A96B8
MHAAAVTTGVAAATVGDAMTRCPVSVRAGAPFATVAAVPSRNAIGAVPVVDRDDGARPRATWSPR